MEFILSDFPSVHGPECLLLRSNHVEFHLADTEEACRVLAMVSPLRLLLLPPSWRGELEEHGEARRDTPIWLYNTR